MTDFRVTVGEYEDKTYFIVRGAASPEEAYTKIRTHIIKNHGSNSWMLTEDYDVEPLKIKKGVTQL